MQFGAEDSALGGLGCLSDRGAVAQALSPWPAALVINVVVVAVALLAPDRGRPRRAAA